MVKNMSMNDFKPKIEKSPVLEIRKGTAREKKREKRLGFFIRAIVYA